MSQANDAGCRLMGLAGLLAALAVGCAPPAAVTTNLVLAGQEDPAVPALLQEARQKQLLSPADQAEVLSALKSVARGERPVDPPRRAPGGLRWLDVVPAVEEAVKLTEAIVVKKFRGDDRRSWRFLILTIEHYPGEVIVRRVDGKDLYETDIWIGRFPNAAHQVARAEKLRREIDRQMKRLGRQKWFNKPLSEP